MGVTIFLGPFGKVLFRQYLVIVVGVILPVIYLDSFVNFNAQTVLKYLLLLVSLTFN